MPRPWRKAFEGAKYHVTCRGNGRERIVLGEEDAQRFREQLGEAVVRDGVVLYAWALMSNHYHLLVETPRGNISGFMQRLNTAYAMYFRHKRARPGHCFQGRYGAKLVSGDDYLVRLTRYIHLNPVKIKAMREKTGEEKWKYLMAYRWSSFRGYVDGRHAEEDVRYRWLELMHRRGLKACRRAYAAYARSCLEVADDVLGGAYERSVYAIGDEDYVREVEEEVRRQGPGRSKGNDVLMPAPSLPDPAETLAAVSAACGVSVETIQAHGRKAGLAKTMVIELVCRLCGRSQREVGTALGLSEHVIGKQRSYMAEKLKEDSSVASQLNQLLRRLSRS